MTIELEPLFDGEKASDHPEHYPGRARPITCLHLLANDIQRLCMSLMMVTGDDGFIDLSVHVWKLRNEQILNGMFIAKLHDAMVDCHALVMKNVKQNTQPTEENVKGQQILSAIRNTPL